MHNNSARFTRIIFVAILLFIVVLISIRSLSDPYANLDLPDQVDFNYHVRPILSQNCFVCHGPDSSSREAGLRLDTYEGATRKLQDGGKAIVPGNSRKSQLIKRVHSDDPNIQMPPPKTKKRLTEAEVGIISKWIDQGAKWKPHWSFIKPQNPAEIKADQSISDNIDMLIYEKLQSQNLDVSPRAKKYELVRRVSYLLTGLPPSLNDLDQFNNDDSEVWYERMIDYYLASPHFGERWARHWMDLVRYAEYQGHEFDYPINGAYHYRDYLIRAFNSDVSYDQLILEHLAGDMLTEPRRHEKEKYNESVLGTAYLNLGEGKHSPVSLKEEEYLRIDNTIDVTSKTFQGLTVSCARCHDHKFDPIPTTDYYSMYGMFESSRPGLLPAKMSLANKVTIESIRKIRKGIGHRIAEMIEDQEINISIEKSSLKDDQEGDTAIANIGDFSSGTFDGWFVDGFAFGDQPISGIPVIQSQENLLIQPSFASSRANGTGIYGVIRSPNFTVQHDSIMVKGRGFGGSIRIVVDNFQLIQDPIYGSLDHVVENHKWKTYTFDLSMVQGHKAYVEILPGLFDKHQYYLEPEHYVEVEYVAAFTGPLPQKYQEETLLKDRSSITSIFAHLSFNKSIPRSLSRLIANQRTDIERSIDSIKSLSVNLQSSDVFPGMVEGDAVNSPVFIRGDFKNTSDSLISRKFLAAAEVSDVKFPETGSGRKQWGEALVHPDNPLTSRVMVNRLWHHLFGKGIVKSVDNFGLQGELPSHPKLLDYLAIQFVSDSWSIKNMLRHILLSETFQRSTVAIESNEDLDPNNQLYHHFPIRRLEAEAIRDGILAVTGVLDSTQYGPPVEIYLNEFLTGRGRPRESGPLDGAGRRSIYITIRRNFLPPMMLSFDMPIPFSTFGKRNVTNVPAQSLTLLNDPFIHDQADRWARYIIEIEPLSQNERINLIYRRAFARLPRSDEIEQANTLLYDLEAQYASISNKTERELKMWKELCHTVFNFKEFIYLI